MIETIQLPNAQAEMSHRLLPSIDGMLKISRLLVENDGNRLSPRQVDYAQTLYSSATELWLAMERMVGHAGCRLSGCKLLLVASDMCAIYALTGALEEHGLRVVHAMDGDELDAALAGEGRFDGVLIDDGDERLDFPRLLRRLRADGNATPVIPIGGAEKAAEPAAVCQLVAQLRKCLDSPARC